VVPLLDKFKIDDIVGAIPVHLICSIWGTVAVASSIVWMAIKMIMGVRRSDDDEALGLGGLSQIWPGISDDLPLKSNTATDC
jgi:ammonia channel protein AmtB